MPLRTTSQLVESIHKSYRVVVFAPDTAFENSVKESRDIGGMTHLDTISDYEAVIRSVTTRRPDVLLVYSTFIHTRLYELMNKIQSLCPLPVVMFTSRQSEEQTRNLIHAGVNSLVMSSIEPNRLGGILTIAIARFEQQQVLLKELKDAKQRLADRKLIEKAKGLIMEHKGLSEDKAYRSLRELSMNKGMPLGKVAETVIEVMNVSN